MSATVRNLLPFPDEIHTKHRAETSSGEISLVASPVSLAPTAADILLDLNHDPAGSLVSIPPVDQSLEHLEHNVNHQRESES